VAVDGASTLGSGAAATSTGRRVEVTLGSGAKCILGTGIGTRGDGTATGTVGRGAKSGGTVGVGFGNGWALLTVAKVLAS
jgi:hypothetical protein